MFNIVSIHFIRPDYFWGFLPLLLLMVTLLKTNSAQNNWQQVCDAHLIKTLMVTLGKNTRRLSLLFLFILGSLMIIALAGPSWKKLPQSSYIKQQATVIVLDMSSAMSATDIKPSRLQRAKFKIQDLLTNAKDGQAGLIVFTAEAFLVSPLTKDNETLKNLLNELTPQVMPMDGSNLADALNRAAKLIKQSGYDSGNVLILTANGATAKDITTAKQLSMDNIHVSTLGMATPLGAPLYDAYHQSLQRMSRLESESLTKLSDAGNGLFVPFSNDGTDINQLSQFFKQQDATYKKQTENHALWQDDGKYLILLLLPLALLCFRRGFMENISS